MNAAISDAMVTGYEAHIDGLVLPDADDRHVLAAAIAAKADVIVTSIRGTFRQKLWTRTDWKPGIPAHSWPTSDS